MFTKCCDQCSDKATKGRNPASAQSSPSRSNEWRTACTLEAGLPKTLPFLSFHSDHATSNSIESKSGLSVVTTQAR